MDSFGSDATQRQEIGYAFCRSLALVAGSSSVHRISPAGLALCVYPSDAVISSELASWLGRLGAAQPILWRDAEVRRALPAEVIPHPHPAAVALIPLTCAEGPWGAVVLCWREAPALTSEWLTAIAPLVQPYCDRAHLERALQQREERWQALYETSVALTHALGSSELLDVILLRITQLLPVEGASILLLDKLTDEVVISAARSVRQYTADIIGRRLKRGEGIAWRAIETRQPYFVSHYDGWAGRAAQLQTSASLRR